jgi:hypothetical protein
MSEKRIFLICDDSHPDLYVGRIARSESECKPELWNLKVGEILTDSLSELTDPNSIYLMRES